MHKQRVLFFSLAGGLLIISHSLLAQSSDSQSEPSMIVGGVELSLGMQKNVALKKLAHFRLNDLGNDVWLIVQKNVASDEYEAVGHIQFIKGRVHSIARDWGFSQDQSATQLFASLFSALSGVTTKSGTDALIQTYNVDQPGYSSKSIVFVVNDRSFTVSIFKRSGLKDEVSIQERIAQGQ